MSPALVATAGYLCINYAGILEFFEWSSNNREEDCWSDISFNGEYLALYAVSFSYELFYNYLVDYSIYVLLV